MYETGNIMLREDSKIGKKLLKEVDIRKTAIIIDKPADRYLDEVKKEVIEIYPDVNICVIDGKDKQKIMDSEIKEEEAVICEYAEYLKIKSIREGKTHLIFVNIRKLGDKKRIILEGRGKEYAFYFVSNVYKLENLEELRKISINRVHILKKGFGLARSPLAFARKHEIVFAGASHLKRNAFIIALERNVTVPCIIVAEDEEGMKEVEEAIDALKTLEGKSTRDEKEYLKGKKWVYITTHRDLLRTIRKNTFIPIKEITKCVLAYSGTDKTMHLIAMHQVAQNIFTLITTKDRGKSKKIVETLPKYGIILEEHAEALRKSYQVAGEAEKIESTERQASQ